MVFKLTFEISPPAVFGLPQEGVTVIPSNEKFKVHGPTIHRVSGQQFGFGTLSRYRPEDKTLNVSLSLDNIDLNLHDNVLFLTLNEKDHSTAYSKAIDVLEALLQHLTLELGRVFEYECKIIEDEEDRIYRIPKTFQHLRLTTYNIDKLEDKVKNAAKFYGYRDDKLLRALQYYEHSILLFEKRDKIVDTLSRHHTQLLSSIFLNLWKAATVIIGDPSKDSDYQSRYKELGFKYSYFEEKIEFLRDLRNDYDVAHYTLDQNSNKEIDNNFRKAVHTVTEILKKYRTKLENQ